MSRAATRQSEAAVADYTAGYIRLTREESLKKGLSAPAQRSDIGDYVTRTGLPPVRYYEETKPVGGDVAWERRTEGKRLVADIRAGLVKHVVVRDMDRLIRDTRLWLQLSELCTKYGVTVHTLSGPLLCSSPTDKFATTVRAAACELEKDQVGDRVRRVKRQMARQGRHAGGPPPYGYTSQARRRRDLMEAGVAEEQATLRSESELPLRGHLYPDEAESAVVRLIFDQYVNRRWGSRRICNELNRQGYRRRSGRLWHPDKLRRIINDPVVAGFIPYDEVHFEAGHGKRTPKQLQTLHRGKHEAIIPESLWRRAQGIKRANTCQDLARGQAGSANRKYPLSGVLRCACGAPMTVSPARAGKSYGYYQCRKRRCYGPDAPGGCGFPRVNSDKVHEAFWAKLSELVCGPELVDRVYEAALQLVERREAASVGGESAEDRINKTNADLQLWYERHDAAKSDIEKEAAWRRVLELTERLKRLKQEPETGPKPPKAKPPRITREAVARYLAGMNDLMGKTEDKGKLFVQSLVEHHGLKVQMLGAGELAISLRLRPPGGEADPGEEYVVPIRGEARLPKDMITAWVEENQDRHRCKCGCGRVINVVRGHYWRGIPEFHGSCRHKAMAAKRATLAAGYYTGIQAAKRLGIGRTTLGRWMATGRLPEPERSISGMLLFDRKAIDELAGREVR